MAKKSEPVSGVLNVATYPNRFNAIIPPEAPFFRTGVKVTATGQSVPLIEGLDYFLGYYYSEAADTFKDAIYGGIILLGHSEVEYEVVPLGREYRIPESEIGKWLVNPDIEDPRNVDWSKLMRYAPTIPAIDPPGNMEEARLRDEVVAALYELTETLKKQIAEMDKAYDECVAMLTRTGKKVFDDGLYQHHIIPNSHPYTGDNLSGGMQEPGGNGVYLRGGGSWVETYSADQVNTLLAGGTVPPATHGDKNHENCLMVAGRAVNATNAFGRTLDQLVDVMSTAGIQQRDMDALMTVALGDLYGRLSVEQNNTLVFKTANDNHMVEINGTSIVLKTKLQMNLIGDRANKDPGVGVEVGAGLNTMMVLSGPEPLAPIYNGVFLITPEQVKLYIHSLILQTANAYWESTPTLAIVGTGKQIAPVTMAATPPVASPTVEGMLALSSIPTLTPMTGTALSQRAVTQIRDDLNKFVEDTFKVNGKSFDKTTQTLTLTKADFQLGNVDNTAPENKPVSKALALVLSLKSLIGHTHAVTDLINVPTASGTMAGMVQLHDALDTTADKVITARQGLALEQKLRASEDKAGVLIPNWAINGSQYGKAGYLPIPAMGNYEGYIRTSNGATAMRREGDTLYILRNGWTGFPDSPAVYYAHTKVNADGSFSNFTQTSYRYHPEGLSEKYPGSRFKELRVSNSDCGVFLDPDGHYYAVHYEGTLNQRKHVKVVRLAAIQVVGMGGGVETFTPEWTAWDCFIYKECMYLIVSAISGGAYRMLMLSMPLADFEKPEGVFTPVKLTGARFTQGDWNLFFKDQRDIPTAENPDSICWFTPEGRAKWSGFNVVHGPMATRFIGHRGGHVRVAFQLGYYCNNAVTSIWGTCWYTTYKLDLDAKTVVLENPNDFPLRLDVGGMYYKDKTVPVQSPGKVFGHRPNNCAFSVEDSEWYFIACGDQAPGIDNAIYSQPKYQGKDLYALGDPNLRVDSDAPPIAGNSFSSGMGSVYVNTMIHVAVLGGNSTELLLARSNDAGYCIRMGYQPSGSYGYPGYNGFGPSNDRTRIDWSIHSKISNMAVIKSNKATPETINGCVFTDPGKKGYRIVLGTTTMAPGEVTISPEEWAKLVGAIKGVAPTLSGTDNGYCAEYFAAAQGPGGQMRVVLWMMGIGMGLAGGPLCIAALGLGDVRADGTTRGDTFLFIVSPNIDGNGVVTFAIPSPKLLAFGLDIPIAPNGLLDSIWGGRRPGQPMMLSNDGVTYTVYIPSVFSYSQIGNALKNNFVVKVKNGGGVWESGQTTKRAWGFYADQPAYGPLGYIYIRELGGIVRYSFGLSTAICSGDLLEYSDFVDNALDAKVVDKVILGAMETAEGWIFYITEEVYVYIDHRALMAPKYELDLSSAFPTNHANQTFHVHVESFIGSAGAEAKYSVGLVRLPDTDTRLYVGTVTTDDKRIVAMDLQRAKRMGRIRGVLEHTWSWNAHNASDMHEMDYTPLGQLRSAPLDDDSPNGGYVSVAKAAEVSKAPATFCNVVLPIATFPWTFVTIPIERFWYPAEVVDYPPTLAQAAKDLGIVLISAGSRKMAAQESFGVKVNFTNTKPTVRLKWVVDDSLVVIIDGREVYRGGSYAALNTQDFQLTPGEHVLALECIETPGYSPVYTGFILYDVDGTTERELVRSGAHTDVGFIKAILPTHRSQAILKAGEYTVDKKYSVLGVSDVATGQPIPYLTAPQPDGSTLVTYATCWYPTGESTPRQLHAGEAELNLMIASTT